MYCDGTSDAGADMNFHILTLFPEMIEAGLCTSIIGRAVKNGIINIETVNIRDFSAEPHGQADDYPYGGGAGMVMQVQPVYDCFLYVKKKIEEHSGSEPGVLYMSAAGKRFDQKMAGELAHREDLIIICGHYEGIDERALELTGAESVTIGDYVLTGGELPAMVITDAVSRMVPGVLTNSQSGVEESFSGDLLEYPQYTRPREFMGLSVPDILLSGHHANIEKWRLKQRIERTKAVRPDLYEAYIKTHEKEE